MSIFPSNRRPLLLAAVAAATLTLAGCEMNVHRGSCGGGYETGSGEKVTEAQCQRAKDRANVQTVIVLGVGGAAAVTGVVVSRRRRSSDW